MQAHPLKLSALQDICNEMNRVVQYHLLSDCNQERQAIIDHCWARTHSSELSSPSTADFNKFLLALSDLPERSLELLAPSTFYEANRVSNYSHGGSLLKYAGMTPDMVNVGIQDTVLSLLCSLESYHNHLHAGSRSETLIPHDLDEYVADSDLVFSDILNHYSDDISAALCQPMEKSDESLEEFANNLIGRYVPGFKLARVAFSGSDRPGRVIYNDSQARSQCYEFQAQLRSNLKARCLATDQYQNARRLHEAYLDEARGLLSEQDFNSKLASAFRKAAFAKHARAEGPSTPM